MSEAVGIKETKELVIGLVVLAGLFAEKMKDGLQAQDAVDVWEILKADPILSEKVLAAYNDIEKVPAEIKDISLVEGIELGASIIPGIAKIISAVKK